MAVATKSVFVLWHVHKIDDTDSEKLIGVYETEELAKEAIKTCHKTWVPCYSEWISMRSMI